MTDNLLLASSVIAVLVIALPIVFHFTRYLGASNENPHKHEPYESGVRKTHKDPSSPANVKFYLIGIIFLLFDVEILFMFPWAMNLRELGLFALIEMFVFIGLLFAGLIYVYKSKVLKWT